MSRPKAQVLIYTGKHVKPRHYDIVYHCSECERYLGLFKEKDRCDRCGSKIDWRSQEPKILIEQKGIL